jgi:hypothetical protein
MPTWRYSAASVSYRSRTRPVRSDPSAEIIIAVPRGSGGLGDLACVAEPQVTVDDRADVGQVEGDGRGDARAADRGGQRQEDIGLAPGKPRVADALARVVDARQVLLSLAPTAKAQVRG